MMPSSVIHSTIDSKLVIGIVAGEASGDSLGADFMAQMNNINENIVWVGVGGAKMKTQGLNSLFPLERLSVMGLAEVLMHLPDLLRARHELVTAFIEAKVDWFIGIDAPDFNLRVAKQLKPLDIFCVQYVSPSVWAWRESRIHNIISATHLVLCLFPFELEIYHRYQHPAVCVGHPLLHGLPDKLIHTPIVEQRRELIWNNRQMREFFASHDADISQIICVMPGSRRSEINKIFPVMLQAIAKLLLVDASLCFVIPTIHKKHQHLIQKLIDQQDEMVRQAVLVAYDESQKNHYFSQSLMAISDMIVLASGTATLEAMLLSRPMVVVYKMNQLTYAIASKMIHIEHISLPNILAADNIVPELIQDKATGDNLYRAILQLMDADVYQQQKANLVQTSRRLQSQSNQAAAHAVIEAWCDYMGVYSP